MAADLSAKLLREQIVEPGRVTFPAAIRHNYNLLYNAVKLRKADGTTEKPVTPLAPAAEDPKKTPAKDAKDAPKPAAKPEDKPGSNLEIKTFSTPQPAPAPAAGTPVPAK